MQTKCYLVAFIGFSGPNTENGAAIIASTPNSAERDAVEMCKLLVAEEYRENFAITQITPLGRDALTKDVYGNHHKLAHLLLRS